MFRKLDGSPGLITRFFFAAIKPCSHIARNLGYRILTNLLLGHRCFQSSGIQCVYVHIILRDVFFPQWNCILLLGSFGIEVVPAVSRRVLCHRMLSGGIET